MSIERREGAAGVRWRVRLHSGGRVVADRTFTTKRAAEVWERQQKEALHGGGFVPPERTRTPVSEVASAFLLARSGQVAPHTLRTDRDNIAALPSMFAARPIGSVSEADILSLLTDLLGVRAHSTVSRLRTTLSALWTWAVREHWAPTNPVRGVRMPSGSVQAHDGAPLTLPVVVAIIDAQRDRSPHGALITEWLSLTGLRWSELRALRVADLQDLPFPAVRVLRAQSDGYAEKAPKSARGRRTVPLSLVLTRSPEGGHPARGRPTIWPRVRPACNCAARTSAARSRGRRPPPSTRFTICATTRRARGSARECRSTRLPPGWGMIRAPF